MSITRRYRLLVAVLWQCLALLLAAGPAEARTPTNIAAELLVEGPAAPGGTVMLAFDMRPKKGWHGYWLNPGDAGLGMQLDWSLPEGATVGQARYPVPETLLIAGLMNHVYKGEYAVLVPFTLPSGAKAGTRLPIEVEARWLACTDEICVPERSHLATTVEVGQGGAVDPRFDRWRARLPAPLGARVAFSQTSEKLSLAIPLPRTVELDRPHVFVAQERLIDYAAAQSFRRKGDLLIVELLRARTSPAAAERIAAVLRLNAEGDGLSFAAMPGPVPGGGEPLTAAAPAVSENLALLLLGALAGGLLLNIMPCVFPILSLKALSLARAGESASLARAEGLAYTGGVVTACLGLGAVLLILRAGGEQVGWAFQLQEPAVVALLLLLAVAITANFLGAFEFAVPGFLDGGSARGAFATGLLAAFVATPCTGPFMAAAMGAALLLPPFPAMALFAALGLGLALPFLAVAYIPALRSRLPRPGPWMAAFRRWMALPMGLTALALAWLAWRVGGFTFSVASATVAALMLTALFHLGRLQRRARPTFFPALAVVIVPALAAIQVASLAELPASSSYSGTLPARPFSEAALAEARAAGKPIFTWFTADWCITCKVNEKLAIEREETRRAFAENGVVVLRGDWTRRDPEITRFLTAHGAAGVPLYVWYPAGGKPRKLPQVLTEGTLVELASGS